MCKNCVLLTNVLEQLSVGFEHYRHCHIEICHLCDWYRMAALAFTDACLEAEDERQQTHGIGPNLLGFSAMFKRTPND